MRRDEPSGTSYTDMRGARITGSAIATGTGATSSIVNAADDPAIAQIARLLAEARGELSSIARDPRQLALAAQLEGTVGALQREFEAPEPDKPRVRTLLRGLLSAGADVATVAPALALLCEAVRTYVGW